MHAGVLHNRGKMDVNRKRPCMGSSSYCSQQSAACCERLFAARNFNAVCTAGAIFEWTRCASLCAVCICGEIHHDALLVYYAAVVKGRK